MSALALFVAWIRGANDVNTTLATDHFAVLANSFDTGSNFHRKPVIPYQEPLKTSVTPKDANNPSEQEEHGGQNPPCNNTTPQHRRAQARPESREYKGRRGPGASQWANFSPMARDFVPANMIVGMDHLNQAGLPPA